MKNKYQVFEDICREILELNNFNVSKVNLIDGSEFDFIIDTSQKSRKIAVEVKHYGSEFVSPKLLNRAALLLTSSAKKQNINEAILVISSNLSYDLRESIESSYKISILDRLDLFLMASKNPDLLSKLKAIVDSDIPDESEETEKIKERKAAVEKIKDERTELADQIKQDEPTKKYCEELKAITPGKDNWRAYELLLEEILKYLFSENLTGWHQQLRSDDGLNRYDLICRIISKNQLWDFISLELSSRYVLFEFKNYKDEISQDQIFSTERYLIEKGKRRVGFIFTRVGINDGGLTAAKGAMRESGKMLIVLNDEDVCNMLEMRSRGDDPTDYLFEKVDDFLLTLSR